MASSKAAQASADWTVRRSRIPHTCLSPCASSLGIVDGIAAGDAACPTVAPAAER